MGFLKTLFGGREESPEEKAEKRREREFDVLKYDGVRARKMGEVKYAIRCFREALALRNDSETASYLAEALLSDKQAEEAQSILAKLSISSGISTSFGSPSKLGSGSPSCI